MNKIKTCLIISSVTLFAVSQPVNAIGKPNPKKPHFVAELTNEATVPFVSKEGVSGSAKAWLVKTKNGLALEYFIETNMDANAGWPTTADLSDDISKIHLHENPPGVAGPHVLNIYKGPAQDDDDLKVYANIGDFSGKWDANDTDDSGLPPGPATEPFDADRLAALCAGDTYVNLHGSDEFGVSDSGVLRGNFAPTRKGSSLCKRLTHNKGSKISK